MRILGYVSDIRNGVIPLGITSHTLNYGSGTYTTGQGTVSWNTNQLPSNWPSDMPVYKNATIQSSVSGNAKTGTAGGMMVSLVSPDSHRR